MSVRVRFAPSPTGSLHLGNALTAVANRAFADAHGGVMLLRIDDTDSARAAEDAEDGILRDLEWLGVRFDEGPVRQSERAERYRDAAERLLARGEARDEDGAVRFGGERRATLLRADGTATYHLATVVDDLDLGVTHVIRGKDHLPNTPLHVQLAAALGARPPDYVHHGLILSPDGGKLSKRDEVSSLSDLRAAGIPAEAVRRYLEELGTPRHDVHLDMPRLRRLAVEAIAALPDEELAARAEAPLELVPALRGARDLREAREAARSILEPAPVTLPVDAQPTLERFRELRERANGGVDRDTARSLVRELKAVGGDLRALRLALTGRDRGPELWAVVAALPREETLRRIDEALQHA
ncbi:MAG: glutamate--tRNA ligase family protein [Actinomycetota bacterium]|nr:glutamate--tRNA ligase family protein [Actinomycetota bacterium]